MTGSASRRFFLAGLLAGAGSAALAEAPLTSLRPQPRPGAAPAAAPAVSKLRELVEAARLGGSVSVAVADAATGELLDQFGASRALPPASTAKAPTALYALDALGPSHRFATRLVATGPIVRGRIEGDLVLQGSGDPGLDTDALGQLAADLKAAGVHEVGGFFRLDDSALPTLPWIDPDQPEHVGYNPTIGALNLNYNRVHFEWKRGSAGYEITMEARALRYRPGVQVARMEIVDRSAPVFTYEARDGIDRWTVAKAALGRDGARWLPVRRPGDYAGEVFRTLARSHGIVLRPGGRGSVVGGRVLAQWQGPPLSEVLAEMLEYSTNLTAEVAGLAASGTLGPVPGSLAGSASRMNGWLKARYGLRDPALVDHSGLGYDSRISAQDMVTMLCGATRLEPLLKEMRVSDAGLVARAKTGTLNFVSSLVGYVPAGNRKLAFAILTADTARRDAIPPDQRERPPGARGWANRSRNLQKSLLAHWAETLRA